MAKISCRTSEVTFYRLLAIFTDLKWIFTFILPIFGAGLQTPKNIFFLVPTNFSYVFKRVKNIKRGIPRYRCILKEPTEHVVEVLKT